MFEPTAELIAEVLAHAEQAQPAECCGVVVDGRYRPIRNKAAGFPEANAMFVMDESEYAQISTEHRIEAIAHSHVYLPPTASEGDRAMCEKLGLPWLIVSWPLGTWNVFEPTGWRAPLVGRQWAWGTQDCFGLIRDAFADYTGIRLPDFKRDWYWWNEGGDLIAQHYADCDFVRLPQGSKPQHCDVLGMRIRAPVVNHLALFLAPDVMLHQLMGQLSVREIYGGVYRDLTDMHFRHRSLMTEAAA